jgi:hypothetical protein
MFGPLGAVDRKTEHAAHHRLGLWPLPQLSAPCSGTGVVCCRAAIFGVSPNRTASLPTRHQQFLSPAPITSKVIDRRRQQR